jgi:tetratricopeptide (TPR) repeat protein
MTLGLAIKTAQGYAAPEVHQAYARARELCGELEDPVRVVPILIALAAHYAGAGEIEASRDIGIEMLKLFEHGGSPHLEMLGEWALGAALFHLGELPEAHRHISRALDLYERAFHEPRVWDTGIEPGIFCRCELARIQCLRGSPDEGLASVRRAVAQARALGHPQPLAFSLLFASFIHHERREWSEMAQVLDEMIALCTAKGIAQELLWAEPFAGLAAFELALGSSESSGRDAGLARMEAGLAAMARTHSAILRPFYLQAYAGMLIQAGRLDAAENALREAQEFATRTRQHAYDADLHRLWGELHASRGDATTAARALHESIACASRQDADWLRRRAEAALDLGRAPGE